MTEQYTGENTLSTRHMLFVRTDGNRQTVHVEGADEPEGTVVQRTPATMVVEVPVDWYYKGRNVLHAARCDVYTIHGVETDGVEDTINATRIVSFPVRNS